jgi:hypothetical protein
MRLNLERLMTIKNFALREGVTPSYIYKLANESKMEIILIDGVKFVDTAKYSTIPVINRRRR